MFNIFNRFFKKKDIKSTAIQKSSKIHNEKLIYEKPFGFLDIARGIEAVESSDLIASCVSYISSSASQILTKEGKTKNKKIASWLLQPNPSQNWGELIELIIQGLLLGGTAFVSFEIQKDGTYESWYLGTPLEVEIVPDEKNQVMGYIYKNQVKFLPEEVMCFKNATIKNRYYGLPTIRPLFDMLNLEAYATIDIKNYFKDGSLLTGLIKSEFPLSSEQATDLRTQFNTLYRRGTSEASGVLVLPNGLDYKTIQSSPSDSHILDTLKLSEERVYKIFKINPVVLGQVVAGMGNNVGDLLKTTFNIAVRPFLYKIEDNINTILNQTFGKGIKQFAFDYSRITELDTALDIKANSARIAYSSGLASLNEARESMGLEVLADENAHKHILPVYLFGEQATYIEDGTSIVSSGANQPKYDSTDPLGGTNDNA